MIILDAQERAKRRRVEAQVLAAVVLTLTAAAALVLAASVASALADLSALLGVVVDRGN